jgi:phosphoribosyl-ATP pyrophosphohydrolase/phosphoribosyl-AMP cyclohydrolase
MLGDVDALLSAAKFDDKGLLAAIAQDATTGVVRMQAWVNAEALRATAHSGFATFYSRSRQELWQKGATSGNTMRVRQIRIDCDGDAVLYLVDAEGPSCHTGKTSCFYRDGASEDDGPAEASAAILSRVAGVIAQRRAETAEKSYTRSLLAAGWPKILGKITEEAAEVVESLPGDDKAHTAHEAADVIFHLLVGLEAANVPLESVFAELRRRFGTSGHTEKASRAPKEQKT